jgi:predicted peroxiredoxin
MAQLLVHCTHGREDPERATLAFVVGNVAASADQDVVVLLTIEGVWTPPFTTGR